MKHTLVDYLTMNTSACHALVWVAKQIYENASKKLGKQTETHINTQNISKLLDKLTFI